MPRIAVTIGRVRQPVCLMPKLGIDPVEGAWPARTRGRDVFQG